MLNSRSTSRAHAHEPRSGASEVCHFGSVYTAEGELAEQTHEQFARFRQYRAMLERDLERFAEREGYEDNASAPRGAGVVDGV